MTKIIATSNVFYPVLEPIKKYSAHPSILSINEENDNVFSFRNFIYEEILNEINNVDTSKSTESKGVSYKIFKRNADIFPNFILQNVNQCIVENTFLRKLKKQALFLSLKKETIMTKLTID